MIIAFEGLDKSGKHTHTKKVVEHLKNKGYDVHHLSFPNYESFSGKLIRDYLDKKIDVDDDTWDYLQFINKYDVMKKYKSISNNPNVVIVIDRYIHTQVAYGKVINIDLLSLLPLPDYVFFMDIPPSVSIQRRGKFGYNDRFEEDIQFLTEVYNKYKSMVSDNWFVIDCTREKRVVSKEILCMVDKVLRSDSVWSEIYR